MMLPSSGRGLKNSCVILGKRIRIPAADIERSDNFPLSVIGSAIWERSPFPQTPSPEVRIRGEVVHNEGAVLPHGELRDGPVERDQRPFWKSRRAQ